ncbi:MAG: hypothetical protein MO853_05815 [Candidatus Protistobacter heckmanni]|nr:hypothetical protein [Candidatus Protistobacter heckmanni]
MASIFQSLGKTVIADIVLLIVILLIVSGTVGSAVSFSHQWFAFLFR